MVAVGRSWYPQWPRFLVDLFDRAVPCPAIWHTHEPRLGVDRKGGAHRRASGQDEFHANLNRTGTRGSGLRLWLVLHLVENHGPTYFADPYRDFRDRVHRSHPGCGQRDSPGGRFYETAGYSDDGARAWRADGIRFDHQRDTGFFRGNRGYVDAEAWWQDANVEGVKRRDGVSA